MEKGPNPKETAADGTVRAPGTRGNDPIAELAALEKKILWLSSWTIHNANHLRERRECLDVGGARDHAQAVTQPLDRGPGDEDAALEGVGGPLLAPGHGREQALFGGHRLRAGVEQHEAPGAVCVLRRARLETRLAELGARSEGGLEAPASTLPST